MNKLSYKIGNRVLLKDINWEIKDGENWIIFGLNGCGKTTLLSIAAGYLPVEADCVELLGQAITSENRQGLCQKVGFVSESFFAKYFHNETVDDIVLGGYSGKLGRDVYLTDQQIGRAKQLLKLFDLHDKSRKPFWLLSKGERQKALLARGLLKKPRILFLDEPCSGLDIFARMQLLELFSKLTKDEGITLVCVTHHFDEIVNIYDKAMLLQKGVIHSQGMVKLILGADNMSDFFSTKVQIGFNANNIMQFQILGEQGKLDITFND